MLEPSDDRPEPAQLAVSPTGRAAHVYLLPGEGGARRARRGAPRGSSGTEGVDLVCWLGRRRGASPVVERGAASGCASGPATRSRDLRGARLGPRRRPRRCCAPTVEDGRLRSDEYPDPLARVFSALRSPHAGDFVVSLAPGYEAVDWGGVTHAGGGSHGSLHAGDSLGPLLFVGCGPDAAGEREQWTLRDVAPVVLEHFGL